MDDGDNGREEEEGEHDEREGGEIDRLPSRRW